MFKFQPGFQYTMPAHFGIGHSPRSSLLYLDVTTISIGYRTDREKLERYLPEPFALRGDPTLVVYYAMNKEVEWMAGGGYNLLGVDAIVRFEGEVDQVDGSYCLVLWENDTDPILAGRDLLGVPKIYADIEDHKIIGGEWRTAASVRGQTIVDLSLADLEPVSEQGLQQMREDSLASSWMGWRHVPNIGEPDAAVSHATCIPSGGSPREAWDGRGEVVWHPTTWEKNPTQHHIVNALADLPILEYRWARAIHGSSTLADANKKPLRSLR
jgi:acetoacetate decarboxylase